MWEYERCCRCVDVQNGRRRISGTKAKIKDRQKVLSEKDVN